MVKITKGQYFWLIENGGIKTQGGKYVNVNGTCKAKSKGSRKKKYVTLDEYYRLSGFTFTYRLWNKIDKKYEIVVTPNYNGTDGLLKVEGFPNII